MEIIRKVNVRVQYIIINRFRKSKNPELFNNNNYSVLLSFPLNAKFVCLLIKTFFYKFT
jgi:hypothetical protein